MRLAQGTAPAGETPPGQTPPGDGTPAGADTPATADAPVTADTVFRLAAAGFQAARVSLARLRDDIVFEDVPAPRRLAPYAAAMGAAVYRDTPGSYEDSEESGEEEIATGRLFLLYDPDGQPSWSGVFRLVAFIRAEVEAEMAADPLLGEVGWSWLTDALDLHVPGYAIPSGTVTRTITEGFGEKADEPGRTEFELRASWSPPEDSDLGDSVAAWIDLLAAAAGLPAQPPGTTALPRAGKPRAGKNSGGKRRR